MTTILFTPPVIMELRQQIGQLFIIGFRGSSLATSDPIARDLRHRNLGGVILFDRIVGNGDKEGNIVSPSQLRELCVQLRTMAKTKPVISIDQEGGMVRRLKPEYGFPDLPTAAVQGKDPSCRLSSRYARETGKVLSEAGINCNFAPVADLNINPDNPIIGALGRSFSHNADTVVDHCRAWLSELQRSGVAGCIKHFPGHGSSTGDSHMGFVDISDSWQEEELRPFSQLIAIGSPPMVMTGHLVHRQFDDKYPASLSRNMTTHLLREKLRFQGVIVTDDLQMRAISDRYGVVDAAILALSAGADMIIIGNNLQYDPDILPKAVNGVFQAVKNGHISEETVQAAFQRVQKLKGEIG